MSVTSVNSLRFVAPPPPEAPPDDAAPGICPLKSLIAITSKSAPAFVIFMTTSAISNAVPLACIGTFFIANPEVSAIESASAPPPL